MKATKITNVNLVANHFLRQKIGRDTIKYFIKATNVNLVANHFLQHTTYNHLQQHIHVTHDGHEGQKCDSSGKTFNTLKNLEKHLHTIHDGF